MTIPPLVRAQIVHLYNSGLRITDIAPLVNINKKRIAQILHNANVDMKRNTFVVLRDPSGLFSPTATFDRGAMCATCYGASWPEGITFRYRPTGHTYTVVDYWSDVQGKPRKFQRLENDVEWLVPKNTRTLTRVAVGEEA